MHAQVLSPSGQRGFTLLELMVVVALVAILASLAAPSFTGMIANQRVSTAAQELQVLLQFARAEAVYRRAPTSVVASDQTWEARDADKTLRQTALSANVTVEPGSADGVLFDVTGRARPAAVGSSAPYMLRISSARAARVQCLKVTGTGIVRQTRVTGTQACP